MDDIWIWIFTVILFSVSIILMQLILPRLIKKLKEKGKIGIDVHKLDKPEVAEMGGISVLIVACLMALVPLFFWNDFIVKIQIAIRIPSIPFKFIGLTT